MIHSIILNMMDPFTASNTLTSILNASENFSHPSEIEMLKEVQKCVEMHREIRDFVIKYSSTQNSSISQERDLPKGLYLEALANSIDVSLDPFRNKIIELEKRHIKNAHLPVSYFLAEMKEFEIFLHFLKRFIDELKTQKFHGCAILGLLHKYNFHADMKSMQALKTIRGGVYTVFLQQLSHWLIYGRLIDKYEEFFIIHSDTCNKKYTIDPTSSIIKLIRLNFNVKWPLHLFFSPTVLENYSEMWLQCLVFSCKFETLKMNYIWFGVCIVIGKCLETILTQLKGLFARERFKFKYTTMITMCSNELKHSFRMLSSMTEEEKVSQLRNKMLFFINNLQYYLHVDVLESQFCGLINSVQNSNFEHTQRAHTIFQVNIMSLSFLLNTDIDTSTTSPSTSQKIENPVYTVLNRILITIDSFCSLNQNTEYPMPSEIMQQLDLIEERFSNNMHELLKLLNNRMAGPASEPLAQLLLRLDFNYWFSSRSN